MVNVIYLDFRKIDQRVIRYIKEKRKKEYISADDAVKLLMVLEGVSLPLKPERIVAPAQQVDPEQLYSMFIRKGNDLQSVFRKLDRASSNYRIMNGENMETEIVKTELAKILVNFM